jgi:3-(3-hydroxy-phenyl)propionate hydroxylase
MAQQVDSDVIIIGCGPTGATLALALAGMGHTVTIIERETAVYPLPRAVHIDDEIMRVFQNLGLMEAITAFIHPGSTYDFRNAAGDTLLSFATDLSHQPLGWPSSNMIYQPGIEGELDAAVARAEGIRQMRGWQFIALDDAGDAITATVTDGAAERTLSAHYLIGCDGARSPVRVAAGIGVDDLQFSEPWLVIDTVLSDPHRLHKGGLQLCDPARPTTSVRISPTRHRWEFMLKPDETAAMVTDDAFIADLLKPWNVEGVISIERRAVYTFEAIVAQQWRKGRVLLAGDAAHQMPPFAGQGMCSGIRDGANLAWKLDAVLSGTSSDALLDSYQVEREPNVRGIIDMALMMGRTVCITDPVAAAHRDAKMIADREAGNSGDAGGFDYPPIMRGLIRSNDALAGRRLPQPTAGGQRLDEVLGAGAFILTRSPVDSVDMGLPIRSIGEPAIAPFADSLERWMASSGNADAVLVRADRYIYGSGNTADLAATYADLIASGDPARYGQVPMPEAMAAK